MVLSNRVNATISSILSYKYLSSDPNIRDALTTLPTPHDQFERMILLPRTFEDPHKIVNRLIRDPEVHTAWLAARKKYGYEFPLEARALRVLAPALQDTGDGLGEMGWAVHCSAKHPAAARVGVCNPR